MPNQFYAKLLKNMAIFKVMNYLLNPKTTITIQFL